MIRLHDDIKLISLHDKNQLSEQNILASVLHVISYVL
jgi:hypothetical protein